MKNLVVGVLASLLSAAAMAQVVVSDAWVAATVGGQRGTGAFMKLQAKDSVRLTGAASSVAGVVEIHEMKMDGNVMKMRAVAEVPLAAGSEVRLQPGGMHVMLMDLRRPLAAGEKITLELRIETADGRRMTVPVTAEVRSRATTSGSHKH